MRVPARKKARRLPIQATSAGPFPTPEAKSKKHPPWERGSWSETTTEHSPTYEKSRHAYLKGKASLSEASRAAANTRRKSRADKCNPAKETCCKPEDPPAVYEACKQKQLDEAGGLENKLIPCDNKCDNNCCCFFATSAKVAIRIYVEVKAAISGILMR